MLKPTLSILLLSAERLVSTSRRCRIYQERAIWREHIAHAMLVVSVASGLVPFCVMAIVAFYGMDKVRFIAPTKIDDTIRVGLRGIDKQYERQVYWRCRKGSGKSQTETMSRFKR